MTRNPDRLVLFTDAVVAIAVTLLILPLVEVVTESQSEGLDARAVITEHEPQIYGFLLSFVVISRFWLIHHSIFEHVKAYNSRLVQLNMLWLLCIVVLPFPTEIVGTYPSTRFTRRSLHRHVACLEHLSARADADDPQPPGPRAGVESGHPERRDRRLRLHRPHHGGPAARRSGARREVLRAPSADPDGFRHQDLRLVQQEERVETS
jgi:hypothetical protein